MVCTNNDTKTTFHDLKISMRLSLPDMSHDVQRFNIHSADNGENVILLHYAIKLSTSMINRPKLAIFTYH